MGADAATRSPSSGAALDTARAEVRRALESQPHFASLADVDRRALAGSLVEIAHRAADLVLAGEGGSAGDRAPDQPVARALAAGDELGLQATRAVAGTTRDVLNAVSFPRFVEELVMGVFKALTTSQMQQIDSYVELLKNVSASAESFGARSIGDGGARRWLVDTYPGTFELSGEEDQEEPDPASPFGPGDPEESSIVVRLRPGASFPSEARLREDLELPPGEALPGGDPERLVPLVRRQLARGRQEMLASLVQMGLQRIVIEDGSIEAGMRFHIDAGSAAEADRGSRFSLDNTISAKGSFGAGPWGVSASVSNTIGYVSTEQVHTTEQVNTAVDVNSNVRINFRSDYLPLASLANDGQAAQIRSRSRNPSFDGTTIGPGVPATRITPTPMADRRRAMTDLLRPAPAPAPQPAPEPGAPAGQPAPAAGAPAGGQPAGGAPAGGQPAGGAPAGGQPAAGAPAGGQPAPARPAPGAPGASPPAPPPVAARGGTSGAPPAR